MKTPDTFQSKEGDDLIRYAVKRIADFFLNNDEATTTGLMGGESGIILFLYYYSYCFNKTLIPYTDNRLEKLLAKIENQETINLSYAEGLSGISTMMCHLAKKGFIAKENYISEELYQILLDYTISEISNNNYDLLYGAGGGVLFFLNDCFLSNNRHSHEALLFIMSEINKRANNNPSSIYASFQTGIAHGYASWLIMLPYLVNMTSTDSSLLTILLHVCPVKMPEHFYRTHMP